MSAQKSLTTALQRQVLVLEDDLRARVESDPEVLREWTQTHDEALRRRRTSAAWQAWRDDRVTQAAVAWVLTTVFIRFCEDNALVSPVWLTGQGARRQEALDAELAFYRVESQAGRDVTSREWLWQAVEHLASLPATRALVDEHSALHLVQPSGDAAGVLLAFWRERGDDGELMHDLTDPDLDTRFLGDLYQSLSDHAKSNYALLQTPKFVENFILDHTLNSALKERPLETFKLIDPTCGSGHFLLGSFDRLLDRWQRHAPGLDHRELVQRALDAIHGVDINPFAVAIARFRLTVAAVKSSGLSALAEAPAFRFHVAVGDSLLHGSGQLGIGQLTSLADFVYPTEDAEELSLLLAEGRYDVVVGNPPYISVKDAGLRDAYRKRFPDVVVGKYVLAVPFMKRFFELAKPAGPHPAGWVGQITANSFMKREFGKPLVERFLASRDLHLIVDSSGAQIPGHNTPTIILVGKNQEPTRGEVRVAISLVGETPKMLTSGGGPLWQSVVKNIDSPGWRDTWIEVSDTPRGQLALHPWTLGSDTALAVKRKIDQAGTSSLRSQVARIGFFGITGADEIFLAPAGSLERHGVDASFLRDHVAGEEVRDWVITSSEKVFYPYDENGQIRPLSSSGATRFLWPRRAFLAARRTFAGQTYEDAGRPWWGWHQLPTDAGLSNLFLTYANIATHTHVAEANGDFAYNSKAVVIKFAQTARPELVASISGLINSSVGTFWLRSVSLPKPLNGDEWQRRYEFDASKVGSFPIPDFVESRFSVKIQSHARRVAELLHEASLKDFRLSSESLQSLQEEVEKNRRMMVALQEELDWKTYWMYGLTRENLSAEVEPDAGTRPGERAFEIALARRMAAGAVTSWFSHHSIVPSEDTSGELPAAQSDLVRRRLAAIEAEPLIGFLERPEFKRRWIPIDWQKRKRSLLANGILSRLEEVTLWQDAQGRPQPQSIAQLADKLARDREIVELLALWEGRPDVPIVRSLERLTSDQCVPYLAAYRLTNAGLRKYRGWEEAWNAQRDQDTGKRVGAIPLPARYRKEDFREANFWASRGSMDVPKERFILYPAAGRDTDPTPLLGWAGWDHAQQSLALSVVLGERESEGWADERLVPLVAGLEELQPWVDQWHGDVDPTYGVSLAAFTNEELTRWSAQVGLTRDELAAWDPGLQARGRKRRLGTA